MLTKELDAFLNTVEKPARYTGGELNAVVKKPRDVAIRFAFCFPDVYEVGMSHLGMRILYHLLNSREDTYCERVFAPWVDMEEQMRKHSIPLYGLESKEGIGSFDFIGFTLQYEMSYSNILNMLELAGVPLLAKDRKQGQPFVCAGGPCAYNGEPLADFIDFFMLGEGEEIVMEVMDAYRAYQNSGRPREEFLMDIAKIEGVYVPSFYDVSYRDDGTVLSIAPNRDGVPSRIRKRIIKDLDQCFVPDTMVVPYLGIVHDRIMLELFRGCTRGCRFCQAGMIYRPVRERSPEVLVKTAYALSDSTGYEEMSLASLSTSDYTRLGALCDSLLELTTSKRINLTLPSLRLDSFSMDLMKRVQNERKSSLTFAPEAGTQRLRDIINKNITEEDLISSATMAFQGGFSNLKLYFMIGLPYETMEDVSGIAQLAHTVLDQYFALPKEERTPNVNITVSTSSFVPKPFTPFQWAAQDSMEALQEKQQHLKRLIKNRRLSYNWHDSDLSFMEAVFARGDRRLGSVLLKAHELGCKFDGWNQLFQFESYLEAFRSVGLSPEFYASRKRDVDEILPWEHIDVGVTKAFLQKEWNKAANVQTTPSCREQCSGCGITSLKGGKCFV